MNLDSLTHTSGEWLRGTGPESDIVIYSRIRLARNIFLSPVASIMYHTSGDRNAPEGNLTERVVTLGVAFTFQPGR